MSANVDSVVFYDVSPFGMVDKYLRFGGTCFLHLQDILVWRRRSSFLSNAGTSLPENEVYSILIWCWQWHFMSFAGFDRPTVLSLSLFNDAISSAVGCNDDCSW